VSGVDQAVISVQVAGGVWEVFGTGRARGIVPQAIKLDADSWGSSRATFELRRDPGVPWPDIYAYSPIEIDVGGQRVWRGRISEAPTRDGDDHVIAVSCEGTQFHLDDDIFRRIYVHTKTSEHQDQRSFATADLVQFSTVGQVTTQNGVVVIGFGKGSQIPGSGQMKVGVTLDLGLDTVGASRVVIDWESPNNAATNANLYSVVARGSDDENTLAGGTDALTFILSSGASGTAAGTFGSNRFRYVHIFIQYANATGTIDNDYQLKIKAVKVFTDTAYESGNLSILKASDVVKDSRDRGALLLSADNSQIQATSFNVPEFAPPDYGTARQKIEAINAFHDWRTQVDVFGRLVFKARPTAPSVEIGEWSGSVFEDASANSGEDIYNRVVVTGTGPDDAPIAVTRYAGQVSGSKQVAIPGIVNPSFDTNTTGWTVSAGTLTRQTGAPDTAPANGQWNIGAWPCYIEMAIAGTFQAGVTYTVAIRKSHFLNQYFGGWLTFGDHADTPDLLGRAFADWEVGYTTYSVSWTPKKKTVNPTCRYSPYLPNYTPGAYNVAIDSAQLFRSVATLIDQRGFIRTKQIAIEAALTQAAAQQIGDTFLANHRAAQLRGSIQAQGMSSIRGLADGRYVHPSALLRMTGERVRLAHRTDPDTGGHGRDGTIASVSYDHDARSVSVEIDNRRSNFEALLSRLAVVTGQIPSAT
jgi:hypothetical protein